MISVYPKRSNEFLTSNFQSYEMDCVCMGRDCVFTYISGRFIQKLQALRDRIGKPLVIKSGYRCTAHQKKLQEDKKFKTSKGVSTHELGMAVDIRVNGLTGIELEEHARAVGFLAVGTASTWIHVDDRQDKFREWSY